MADVVPMSESEMADFRRYLADPENNSCESHSDESMRRVFVTFDRLVSDLERECAELRKDVSALKRTYMADLSKVAVETLDRLVSSVRVEIVGGDDPLAVARLMVNGFGVASWPAHTEWRRTSESGHKYAEECARVLVKAVESLRPREG